MRSINRLEDALNEGKAINIYEVSNKLSADYDMMKLCTTSKPREATSKFTRAANQVEFDMPRGRELQQDDEYSANAVRFNSRLLPPAYSSSRGERPRQESRKRSGTDSTAREATQEKR